jgi:hypothetical protein
MTAPTSRELRIAIVLPGFGGVKLQRIMKTNRAD